MRYKSKQKYDTNHTSRCGAYGQVIRFKWGISGVTVALQWLYSGSTVFQE
ncbi:hypothetical protein [Capnocytophaga ochracea]|uniref:Uncharacterized protein n=1 Tax=Capnocytophaga ochracea TaxID=1018 RepID=A0AA46WAM2_CAPOC|nr:hypothetical protein [Capnocytophaga ochracea]UZD41973.1 hypothetical protein OL231_05390 [Capnocytophaga ochracea]